MLIHHSIDTQSDFQWTSSEKDDSGIITLLEVMAFLEIPLQTEAENASVNVSLRLQQCFIYHDIEHVTSIPYNPTRQTIMKRSNVTLKKMLIEQKGNIR